MKLVVIQNNQWTRYVDGKAEVTVSPELDQEAVTSEGVAEGVEWFRIHGIPAEVCDPA